MYYNSPTKTFHPNLQQESFHIPSLSSMYHLRTSQSLGTMSWEHPPISELCHGNMTIKHIHFNTSSTSSHLYIPPLSLMWRALPFLLLPKFLSSEGAPIPDSLQLHRWSVHLLLPNHCHGVAGKEGACIWRTKFDLIWPSAEKDEELCRFRVWSSS